MDPAQIHFHYKKKYNFHSSLVSQIYAPHTSLAFTVRGRSQVRDGNVTLIIIIIRVQMSIITITVQISASEHLNVSCCKSQMLHNAHWLHPDHLSCNLEVFSHISAALAQLHRSVLSTSKLMFSSPISGGFPGKLYS